MYAHHMSQFNISRRIIGAWLRSRTHIQGVKIELVDTGAKAWQYKVQAYGFNLDLYVHKNGAVHARLWCYSAIAATSSTLAGFCALIKNCKRWSQGN